MTAVVNKTFVVYKNSTNCRDGGTIYDGFLAKKAVADMSSGTIIVCDGEHTDSSGDKMYRLADGRGWCRSGFRGLNRVYLNEIITIDKTFISTKECIVYDSHSSYTKAYTVPANTPIECDKEYQYEMMTTDPRGNISLTNKYKIHLSDGRGWCLKSLFNEVPKVEESKVEESKVATKGSKKKIVDVKEKDIAKEKKPKKKSIPANLKRKVWNKWIGEDIGKAKCLCCKLTDISQLSFHCGHIIAESEGGELRMDNLKPICQSCNSSIGSENMDAFERKYGF